MNNKNVWLQQLISKTDTYRFLISVRYKNALDLSKPFKK